jgi:hypothetical protein
MEPYLVAIWDRLVRAKQHFDEIDGMLLDYYQTRYGGIRGEFDIRTEPYVTLEGDGFAQPNPRMYTLAGELLHDLRSSLDHLAWVLVVVNGGEPTRDTSFPVLKVRPAANRKGIHPKPGVAGGVSEAGAAVIDAAQPYQWKERFAEHPIWVLDKLWNIDKHRHVVLRGIKLPTLTIPIRPIAFSFTLQLDGASVDGAELRLVPDDPNVNVDFRATAQVILHEPEEGVSEPLRATLEDLHDAVVRVVQQAQDTCFKTVTP